MSKEIDAVNMHTNKIYGHLKYANEAIKAANKPSKECTKLESL